MFRCHCRYFDWNLILDEDGGPNNAKDNLGVTDAPIILNKDSTEMYKQPMFYVYAHFSRFIVPGSMRIDAKLNGVDPKILKTIAFQRPDETVAVILYNNSKNQTIDLTVKDSLKNPFQIKIKPKSLNTLIYMDKIDTECELTEPSQTNIFIIPSIWS